MAIKYDSQRRAVAKYNSENYDVIQIRVPKGDREGIKAFAESRGETLNGFLLRLIREAMHTDDTPMGAGEKQGEDSKA